MAENVRNIRSVSEVKPIDPEKLRKATREYQRILGDQQEAQGELGAHVKKVENDLGLHRQAFKTGAKLQNWDEAKRADFLRTFDAMRAAFEWDAPLQADMIDEVDGNVVALAPPEAETPEAPEVFEDEDESIPSPA